MRVGIVGSRKYRNQTKVEQLVDTLIKKYSNLIIVSGGCQSPRDSSGNPQNVDVWAERHSIRNDIPTDIKLPDLTGTRTYVEICKRYYDRNEKIVLASDVVFAFFNEDPMSGGAMNTVKWTRKYNKPTIILFSSGKVIKERC